MRTTTTAVSGDVQDYRDVRWNGTEDLAGVDEVEAHVWLPKRDRVVLEAEVLDAGERTIRIFLGDDGGWLPTAAAADWRVEVQCTWTDGTVLTSPAGIPNRLVVRASGDPVDDG